MVKMVAKNAEALRKRNCPVKKIDCLPKRLCWNCRRNNLAPPRRIEGYDISNLQGKNSVGAMVVFEDGYCPVSTGDFD